MTEDVIDAAPIEGETARELIDRSARELLEDAGYTLGGGNNRREVVDASGAVVGHLASWEVWGWLAERGELPEPWTSTARALIDMYRFRGARS